MSVRNNQAMLAIRGRNHNPRRADLLFSNLQSFHKKPPLGRSEYASKTASALTTRRKGPHDFPLRVTGGDGGLMVSCEDECP